MTVAQHIAHPLVVGEVTGWNLGIKMLRMVFTAAMSDVRH